MAIRLILNGLMKARAAGNQLALLIFTIVIVYTTILLLFFLQKGQRMRKIVLLSGAVLAMLTSPVIAQQNGVVELPDGQTALNISATERVEVDQDMLVASLRIQQELKDASEVQNVINTAMNKAVALAKEYPTLKIETGQYYVSPDYRQVKNPQSGEETQEISQWRGSQTITIRSKNAEDTLKVTGQIQDMGFVMNNLGYELSTEKYEETRDALMEDTVTALQERAQRVAKALGKSSVDIIEINVDAQPMMPQPMYARAKGMEMMAMSSDAMVAPTAEAGLSEVSMTINARAILKP